MLLSELLSIDRIKIPLESENKDDLLRELVSVAAAGEPAREEVLRAVREREAVLSTGIGHGVAIPHGKSSAVGDLRMAAGRAGSPVDFDALDGEPVSLFFLLVGPESQGRSAQQARLGAHGAGVHGRTEGSRVPRSRLRLRAAASHLPPGILLCRRFALLARLVVTHDRALLELQLESH